MKNLQAEIHNNASRYGWWDHQNPNILEKLALVHSEVSEAVEDFRIGNMDYSETETGKPVGFPAELADIVIRVFDLAGYLEIDLESVIRKKHEYNKTRTYRHGGKRA